MQELVTINNIRGYIDNQNIAWLHIEDVVRGLGFVDKAKSGNIVIRWARVMEYLKGFNFVATSGDVQNSQQTGKDFYIPENIFYRLCMKAKNETAEQFQVKIADEVLPQIRKTGSYQVQPQLPQTYLEALRQLLEYLTYLYRLVFYY